MRYLCFVNTDETRDQVPQTLMDPVAGAIEMRGISEPSPATA